MHTALKYSGEKDIIYVIYPQMVQKTYCVCMRVCVEEVNKRAKCQQLGNRGKGYTSVLRAIFATFL